MSADFASAAPAQAAPQLRNTDLPVPEPGAAVCRPRTREKAVPACANTAFSLLSAARSPDYRRMVA